MTLSAFKQYLYVHKEMTSYLQGLVNDAFPITSSVIILCMYVIIERDRKGKGLTRDELFACRMISVSTNYRIIEKCIENKLITEEDGLYNFPHTVPPHLLMEEEMVYP